MTSLRWLICLLLTLPALADKPASVTLCFEDQENYPWILPGPSGYVITMVEMVGLRSGLHVVLVAKPWKRCLAEMQQNVVDGVVNASFVPERLEMGVYPMRDGKPDIDKRMLEITYSLYRPKEGELSWDGSRFSNLKRGIAVQHRFSIIGPLRAAGANVLELSKDAEDVLRQVQLGVADGAALLTHNGDRLLQVNPELAANLEKVGPPLDRRPNFIMLSRRFVAQHPVWAQRLWDTVGLVRESAEFKQAVAPWMQKP